MDAMADVMIITGTRKGIGRYLLDYYSQNGYTVSGCSRGSLTDSPPEYEHFCLDVSDEAQVINMVRQVADRHGKIDVLVNNAGIASMNHILLTPGSIVEKIFSTNVTGTFLFVREVGKVMAKQKYGRIVNVVTVATPLKLEGEAIYASSKAAIASLTEVAARELAPFNVTVNAVGPTPIETDLISSVPERKIASLIGRQAIKRMGQLRDVSNVIDFFISKDSDFVTGQIVYLGGIS
jgi:3-oxoacyl-[acyl-carrier protein] reductase